MDRRHPEVTVFRLGCLHGREHCGEAADPAVSEAHGLLAAGATEPRGRFSHF